MEEENICLICLDSNNLDTLLLCCNKFVHGSCIKQWWNLNNIPIENATCPHCQQSVVISKIENFCINLDIKESQNYPNGKIIPNINFEITDDEINIINSNSKNKVPKNLFLHQDNPDENNSKCTSCFCCSCFITAIVIITIAFILL